MATSACGVHRVQISGAVPNQTRPAYTVEIDAHTIPSVTIAAHRGMPEVVIPDVPSLFRGALGVATINGESTVRLAVLSIDFDSTDSGDEHLARDYDASTLLAHGTFLPPPAVKSSVPRYVRIKFVAELWRQNASLGRVTGTVSGKRPIGASDGAMLDALASAIDQLVALIDRALIGPHIASQLNMVVVPARLRVQL